MKSLVEFLQEANNSIFTDLIKLYQDDKGKEFLEMCKEYTKKNKTLNKFQKMKLATTKNGLAIIYMEEDQSKNYPEAGGMLLKAGDDDWFTLECNNDDYTFDMENNDDELCATLALKFEVCWFNDVPNEVVEFFKKVKEEIKKRNNKKK